MNSSRPSRFCVLRVRSPFHGALAMSALLASAWNRRFTLALTVLAIALSTFLLLGVERIRTELRQNFASSVRAPT